MRSPVAGIAALIALFVVIIVGYSSVFTVAQTEQVLVVRLGEPIRVVTEPGLNFKAPFIDTVIPIDKRILDLENPSQEVIASDQKRLVVDAFARYRIKNALRFYQSVGSIPAANIQLTTLLNASLRRVLGEVSFITVVRDQREALMARIREQLDKEADGYGIQVQQVQMQKVDPPAQVIDSFRDVQAARADLERLQNEAQTYANRVVPDARGRAAQILQVAEGYKQQAVAEAKGQSARFLKVYDEYKKAPDVTRQRIYLETMERILGSSEKLVYDGGSSSQSIVPYLPLSELTPRRQAAPGTTGQQQSGGSR